MTQFRMSRLLAALLAMGALLASLAVPVGAQEQGEEPPPLDDLVLDDPESVDGLAEDPGNEFPGFEFTEQGEVDADKKPLDEAASKNATPPEGGVGDEGELALPTTVLPELEFPQGEVLGDLDAVREALSAAGPSSGQVRVIVTARPEAGASSNDMTARVERLDTIEAALDGTDSKVLWKGQHVPVMVVEMTSAGLDAALGVDATGGVELDTEVTLYLDETIPVIGADETKEQKVRGGGDHLLFNPWEVAILDNGVFTDHQGFDTRIVDEACYTTDSSCPNGANSQTGPGASFTNSRGHGTHVSGIAAGRDIGLGDEGVAPQASIVAVNVFNASNSAAFSSIIAGVDFVVARENAGARVASINMSLGTGTQFTGNCDATFPSVESAFAAARSAGILVIASAGNASTTNGSGSPACVTSAFGVASTTDSDAPSGFTSISSDTELWAPGSSVTAPYYRSDTDYATLSGTSMSAPHVAGAAAALASCVEWSTPAAPGAPSSLDDNLASLTTSSGVSVTDTRAGGIYTLPRLDVLAAAQAISNPNDSFSAPETLTGTSGVNVDRSQCATVESGEPSFGVASTWYTFTAPSDGALELSTCDVDTTADTILEVFTGSTLGSLTSIGVNDDDYDCSQSVRHSQLVVPVDAGVTYRVRASVYDYGPGPFVANGKYDINYRLLPLPTCDGKTATIIGTPGPDTLFGTAGDDVIVAGAGDDYVEGLEGNDTICLGDGFDYGNGGLGADKVLGGRGCHRHTAHRCLHPR